MTEKSEQKLILVTGTGYSGATALLDYFKEFNNINVWDDEFDILRHSGGIFELEHIIDSQNIFSFDSAIKRFMRLVEYLQQGRGYERVLGKEFREAADEFLENIILVKLEEPHKLKHNRKQR